MKIGLISDTHIPGGAKAIPPNIIGAFEGVDIILHAGNIYTTATLDYLESIAPVKAAASIDRDMSCYSDPRVAEKQVMEVEGHSIGVIHDLIVPGFTDRVYPGSLARGLNYDGSSPIIPDEMFGISVDIVVFGHTCTALIEEYGGTMLINPGSPTLRNESLKIGTVAVLDLTPGSRKVQIVDLADAI